jgi:two-component system, cell cycle sensor histidine kinase and response regulator CckA
MHENNAPTLSASVLGQLLLMQSVLCNLPDEKSIFSFVIRGLADIPGVAEAAYSDTPTEKTDESQVRLPLHVRTSNGGEILIRVSDPLAFGPYEAYLKNFCFMVAVILEERHQHRLNEEHRTQLEQTVQERTKQLTEEIAERRLVEEELHRNRTMLAHVLNSVPQSIFWKDRNSVYLGCNEAFARVVGEDSPEQVVGKTDFDFPWPREYAEAYRADDREVIEHREPKRHIIEPTQQADGTRLWIDTTKIPLTDETGHTYGIMGVFEDITDRKRAEEALRKSEERLRLALLASRQGLYDLNVVTGEAVVTPEYALMLGYDPSEFVETNQKWIDRLHPDDRDRVAAFYRSYVAGEYEDYQVEFRQRTKSGDWLWILSFGKVVEKNMDGSPLRMVGTHLDITARKLAEEELQQKTELISSLFQASPLAMIALDREGIVTLWNPAAERMFGWTENEALGCLNPVVPEEKQDEFRGLQEILFRGESFSGLELTCRKKDGTAVEISLSTAPLTGLDGKIVRNLAVIADITHRKRAEEVQRRLATAIEQSIESVMITDGSGNIQYVNPAFVNISGYSSEEVVGHKPRFLKSDQHDKAFYKDMTATIRSGEAWKGRLVSKRKDGKLYHEDVTISPVRNSAGQIINYVDVGHDVTQRVQLEKQLVQAQKMEAIGTLAGGIAHDFNNLLQIILGYSELVLLDQTEKDRRHQELQAIRQAASRGGDLVKQILTFSRRVETNPRPINLNAEVKQAQKLLVRTIPKMIDIQLLLADDLKIINADPGQIEQILLNLAVNAQHAMPEGGKIVIQTENTILDTEYCETHLDVKPGEYALLTVSDTGHGMEKGVLDHIFEPFYSTKTPGEGTGLGLAMVFGIVKGHGGHVECYSEPDEGATFRIYLPALEAVERNDVETSQEMPAFGTETILLVDDEALIIELGKRILSRAGYTVLTASKGKEALEVYRSRRDEISLVILDLIMPEMGGKQCLEEILRIDPEARVLIASGYAAESLPRETTVGGAVGFIRKPYKMEEMLRVIRKVLDADR